MVERASRKRIFIDFETRSRVKPSDKGVVSYAQNTTTEVVSIQWALEDGEVFYFSPLKPNEAERKRFARYFSADNDYIFVSHNILFDWCIYTAKKSQLEQAAGAPLKLFKISDTECTMYACAALNLPLGLGEVGEYLVGESKEDKTNMLRFAAPNAKTGEFAALEGSAYEQFREYALQDIVLLRKLYHKTRIPQEWLDELHTSMRMNIRGVDVDTQLVESVWKIIPEMVNLSNKDLDNITQGVVTKTTQSKRMLDWANAKDIEYEKQYDLYDPEKYEDGYRRYTSLKEGLCSGLLAEERVHPDVKKLLLAIKEKPAESKWKGIRNYISGNNTLTGCFNPRGALSGRWSSKGVNLQNLPARGGSKDFDMIEMADNVVKHGIEETTRMMGITKRDIVKLGIRPAMKARKGYRYIIRDFSQMEDRIACLLCGNNEGLEDYRKGVDPYKALARSTLFNKQDISAKERYIAKQAKLALNYGMGRDGFVNYCKTVGGFEITHKDLGISKETDPYQWVVDKYRSYFDSLFTGDNAWTQMDTLLRDSFGKGKEGTYLDGRIYTELDYDGSKVKCVRICSPWGLKVSYWDPTWYSYVDKWGRERVGYRGKAADTSEKSPKFIYKDLYGGKVFNNLCQGTAHILLASVLVRSDKYLRDKGWGYPLLTVHDEIIWEVKEPVIEQADDALKSMMESFTGMLSAIPVVSTVEVKHRYTK